MEKTGRVLLKQVEAEAYKTVYTGWAKEPHAGDEGPEQFPLSAHRSASLQWPLPEHTLLYREMELRDSFDAGIHRIMLFRGNQCTVPPPNRGPGAYSQQLRHLASQHRALQATICFLNRFDSEAFPPHQFRMNRVLYSIHAAHGANRDTQFHSPIAASIEGL